VLPLALALTLSATALPGEEPPPVEAEDEAPYTLEAHDPRLDLTVWGGTGWMGGGSGVRSQSWGAEATWRFDAVDVGLFGGCYELRTDPGGGVVPAYFAPVYLARIGQRFETRNGLLASFTFGVGALKETDWRSWFQIAIGARATFGPAFLAGELAFESDDLVRLGVGLGVSLF
jgi:hypothetical protein